MTGEVAPRARAALARWFTVRRQQRGWLWAVVHGHGWLRRRCRRAARRRPRRRHRARSSRRPSAPARLSWRCAGHRLGGRRGACAPAVGDVHAALRCESVCRALRRRGVQALGYDAARAGELEEQAAAAQAQVRALRDQVDRLSQDVQGAPKLAALPRCLRARAHRPVVHGPDAQRCCPRHARPCVCRAARRRLLLPVHGAARRGL